MNGYHRANAIAVRRKQPPVFAASKMFQEVSQPFGIHVKGIGSDIDKNQLGTDAMDAARGREKRVRRRDNGVARADSHRHENRQLRIGA